MSTKLKIIQGDITKMKVDAVVNGANRDLISGGGIFTAIHRAAGSELLEKCKAMGMCHTGEIKVTGGYQMPAKNIIHTVCPVYGSENGEEDEMLLDCYEKSLSSSAKRGFKSIAFPNLSTGNYRYPKDEALEIALGEINRYIKNNPDSNLEEIYIVLFTEADLKLALKMAKELDVKVE
jgi:O-acetyl-ADP-ribose deacetylase (regulator of RNase III)